MKLLSYFSMLLVCLFFLSGCNRGQQECYCEIGGPNNTDSHIYLWSSEKRAERLCDDREDELQAQNFDDVNCEVL